MLYSACSYKKDPEKNCDDNAARSHESYMKDLEKSRAVQCMQHEAAKVTRMKTWKRIFLAVLHKVMHEATKVQGHGRYDK